MKEGIPKTPKEQMIVNLKLEGINWNTVAEKCRENLEHLPKDHIGHLFVTEKLETAELRIMQIERRIDWHKQNRERTLRMS